MSFSFEARFSRSEFGIPDAITHWSVALAESRIHFDGEIMQLQSRGGVPTAMSIQTVKAADLAEAAELARKWWGAGLFCVSEPLMEVLGKTDAIEVSLSLHRLDGGSACMYRESKSASAARVETEELARDLSAFLVRACKQLRVDLAIYDEEADSYSVPDLTEALALIDAAAAAPQLRGGRIVVASRLLDLNTARERAGQWADSVELAPGGYVLLWF
jgi:hypothetical protein